MSGQNFLTDEEFVAVLAFFRLFVCFVFVGGVCYEVNIFAFL